LACLRDPVKSGKIKSQPGCIFRSAAETGNWRPSPLYSLESDVVLQEQLGYKPGDFPVAQTILSKRDLNSMYPKMTDVEVGRVIKTVKE